MRASFVLFLASVAACDADRGQAALCGRPTRLLDTGATRQYAELASDYDAEKGAIARVSDRVCRDGDVLRIRQRSGRVVEFGDTLIEGDRHRRSVYNRFDPRLRAHVVDFHFSTHDAAVLLVPDSLGETISLDNAPILSPDGRRFAVASLDLVANYSDNSLEVWRITDSSAAREYAVEADSWGPDSVTWASPDSIRFLRATLDSTGASYIRVSHALVFRDGTWRLLGAP